MLLNKKVEEKCIWMVTWYRQVSQIQAVTGQLNVYQRFLWGRRCPWSGLMTLVRAAVLQENWKMECLLTCPGQRFFSMIASLNSVVGWLCFNLSCKMTPHKIFVLGFPQKSPSLVSSPWDSPSLVPAAVSLVSRSLGFIALISPVFPPFLIAQSV